MNNHKYDLICISLAQNCEKTIGYFFNFLTELKKDNLKVISFIAENGSKDYTLDKIIKFQNKTRLVEFVDSTFIEQFNHRIIRLSKARQCLKDIMLQRNLISKYVLVVDLDDVLNQNFCKDYFYKLKDILQKNKNLFGVSVKSKPYYYDILNFISEEYKTYDVLRLQDEKGFFSYFERKKKIYNLQFKLSKNKNFLSISSFNGMCLYHFNDFKFGEYHQKSKSFPIPEHINLNSMIHNKTKKKILVTDQVTLDMPEEHRPIFNFINFFIIKFFKYFRIYLKKIND